MIPQFIAKLSDNEKKILYVTMIVILVALLDRLFVGPVLDKLRTIDGDIKDQKNSIVRDLRFLSYKDRINKETQLFNKYIPKKAMAEDDINTDFFSRIEKLSNLSNVTLVKSNSGQSKKEKDYNQYYADIECTGEIKNVIAFMHSVNSSDDLFKIVKFNMTPKKGSQSDLNATMTIVKLVMTPDRMIAR